MADTPEILPNDICEVSLRGTLCGQTVLTVCHWRFDTGFLTDMVEALDDFHAKLDAGGGLIETYLEGAANNYTLTQVVLQMISPVRFARFPYNAGGTGIQADPAGTADLAAVIEFSTLFSTPRKLKLGRGMQGGLHYGPVPASKIGNGLIDAAYRAAELNNIGNAFTQVITTSAGNDWQPVIYHRKDAANPYTDVSRYSVKTEARVMRRRTVGRGE